MDFLERDQPARLETRPQGIEAKRLAVPGRRIGNLKGIFTPPLPPLASGPPAPAAAARAQRWRLPQHAAEPCRGGAPQGVARLRAV
jgi:hypothetical protein